MYEDINDIVEINRIIKQTHHVCARVLSSARFGLSQTVFSPMLESCDCSYIVRNEYPER